MTRLISTIVGMLENKFDCVIIIEGNRGLGKSTLAIIIARKVAKAFKEKGVKDYKFHWRDTFIYTRKETKKFFNKWRATGIADELINVTFNRDFYNEDQKDIIKMMNMNRDHGNLFLACVPQFQTIDNQIKNLCKIRLSVVRRGIVVIQSPNKIIYGKDKWDQATNEKIERQWISKGVQNPQYKRLTTFRGIMKFPKLHPTLEEKYQKTKDAKRNIIAQEEMGITDDKEEKDPYQEMITMLKEGKIKNGTFVDGFAMAHNIAPATFQSGLRSKLKSQGVNHKLTDYYWEKKSKQRESGTL
jgi:DNA polymerase III delta prime subunit